MASQAERICSMCEAIMRVTQLTGNVMNVLRCAGTEGVAGETFCA